MATVKESQLKEKTSIVNIRRIASTIVIAICCTSSGGIAQTAPRLGRPFVGKYDSDYGLPLVEGKSGEKDAAALAELKEFIALSVPVSWSAVRFEGTISRGSGSSTTQTPAEMTLAPYGGFRIDLNEPTGTASARFLEFYGGYRNPAGIVNRFTGSLLGGPFIDAAQLAQAIQRSDVSLIDDGIKTIDNRSLHQITLVMPIRPESSQSASSFSVQRAAWLLYFDPQTHYLFKTVRIGGHHGNSSNSSMQVITYGDYRKVQGYEVPFVFVETNNGQADMSFSASRVNQASAVHYSYFQF